MSYVIKCRVSGGVTGTREGYYRSDGQIIEFDTLEEAQWYADHMNRQANDQYATAKFSYEVEKL